MPIISSIQKTIVESDEFISGSSDLVVSIPLSTGETITFTAEREFFTPRQISTNKSNILGLPSESVVGYTSNLIPIVKMPIGAQDITTPQYYAVTVISDVYQNFPIDNYFRELADDLELPDDAGLRTLRDQRNAALEAALALDDLNAAAAAGDKDAFDEANTEIEIGLADAIPSPEIDPSVLLTEDEAAELAALDAVDLTDDYGQTDAASDDIDPTPEVLEEELIERIPKVSGRVNGTEIINRAITLLNDGIKTVEDATKTGVDENGNCNFITVAKGKKGIAGTNLGAKKERKVKRSDVETQIRKVREELAKQNSTGGPISGYFVRKSYLSYYNKLISENKSIPLLLVVGIPLLKTSPPISISYYTPANKVQILYFLKDTEKRLQSILDKEC